jgi:hypothetical protein
MAKFQLTISSKYVPSWSVWEGVRELIQNALDGKQDGHPMDAQFQPPADGEEFGTLRITNAGARLDRQVWLMGVTSKYDGNYRGCYGEGLKLGALALVRAGRAVRIANDDESWRISLEPSEVFNGEPVLTISTRKLPAATGGFCVETAITASEWQDFSQRFLDICPPSQQFSPPGTDVITDPRFAGKLYVKGILVESKDDFTYGYNFHAASVDRDRRIISEFDVRYYVRKAWENMLINKHIDGSALLDFLLKDSGDSRTLKDCSDSEVQEAVAEAFRDRYGSHAVPVHDDSQRIAAGHHGRAPVLCPRLLVDFFAGYAPMDVNGLAASVDTLVTRRYAVSTLSEGEQATYRCAMAMAEMAADRERLQPLASRVEIVDFHSDRIQGVHHATTGDEPAPISIARHQLRSLRGFLETLVHELAHDCGGDGSVQHERAEARLFSVIIDDLQRQVTLLRPAVAV